MKQLAMRVDTSYICSEYFTVMGNEELLYSVNTRPSADIFKKRKLVKTVTSPFVILI